MILGRVQGEIYSTINHPFYDGKKLLWVSLLSPEGELTDNYVIAIDTVGAGTGQTVLVLDEGNSARQIVDDASAPLRSIIVGIVDQVS